MRQVHAALDLLGLLALAVQELLARQVLLAQLAPQEPQELQEPQDLRELRAPRALQAEQEQQVRQDHPTLLQIRSVIRGFGSEAHLTQELS